MDSNNNVNAMQAMNCNLDSNLSFSWNSGSGETDQGSSINNMTGMVNPGYEVNYQSGTTGLTSFSNNCNTITGWDYWHTCYYPQVIHTSYPVYIQEKAKDNGKQAFELIKGLMDRKLVKLNTVKEFVDLMDFFIKQL